MRQSTRVIKEKELMLSDYIKALQDLIATEGDHPIVRHFAHGPFGAYFKNPAMNSILPKLEHAREKTKREQWDKTWSETFDKDKPKGRKIYVL